jgi:tRNA(Ile)-lysidine synthase
MLYALWQIARTRPMPLAVAHFHHGLRGAEADRDAAFVAGQAAELGLPFFIERGDVEGYRRSERLSTEEAARRLRYDFLHRTADANRFSKIAVGHHADDNAESLLLFVLRGSGRRGISGIPPQRGRLVRPLIDCRRDEIRRYLEEEHIAFVLDASNTDNAFVRNRLRNDLIPKLAADYNPNLVETLSRLSTVARAEDDWMEALAEPLLARALVRQEADRILLSVPALCALPKAACRRVLRQAISSVKGDLRRIGFGHIEAIRRLSKEKGGCASLHLPRNIRVYRAYEHLEIRLALENGGGLQPATFRYRLYGPGEVHLVEAGFCLRLTACGPVDAVRLRRSGQRTAFFDMGKIYFPITVRNPRPGDRFRPLGMTGTQKLQDFFTDRKVPRRSRWTCPLVISGGKIAWVVGHRISEDFKVETASRRLLLAELLADPM